MAPRPPCPGCPAAVKQPAHTQRTAIATTRSKPASTNRAEHLPTTSRLLLKCIVPGSQISVVPREPGVTHLPGTALVGYLRAATYSGGSPQSLFGCGLQVLAVSAKETAAGAWPYFCLPALIARLLRKHSLWSTLDRARAALSALSAASSIYDTKSRPSKRKIETDFCAGVGAGDSLSLARADGTPAVLGQPCARTAPTYRPAAEDSRASLPACVV